MVVSIALKTHSFPIDHSKIHLSKTILSPQILTTSFSSFVAKFVFGLWHDIPFQSVVSKPYKGLSHFIQFVHDILKSTSLPFSVVLLGIKYIHRLRIARPELSGAPGSECRLIVCALMLAMKELCDNTYSNKSWKKISGIPLKEINQTEMEFLSQIRFNLYVSPMEYYDWVDTIEQSVKFYREIKSLLTPIQPTHFPSPPLPAKPFVHSSHVACIKN